MDLDLPGTVVVIPVKELERAKTRIDVPREQRARIAAGLAAHVIRIARETPEVSHVLVVSRDPTIIELAASLHATPVRERRWSNLNRAMRKGRAVARGLAPRGSVALLVSDLPELTSGELAAVIAEFEKSGHPLMVADHSGRGTTMLIHRSTDRPPIRFGPGSAGRHRAAGFTPVLSRLPGLRRDADTLPDILAARSRATSA